MAQLTLLTSADREALRARILARVKRVNGCWIWAGPKHRSGYGIVKIKGVGVRAHRASHAAFTGLISDQSFICHHCDNKSCVNPDHLYEGTHASNMRDMVSRSRHNAMQPGARCGEKNPKARLTIEKVMEVRRRLANGEAKKRVAREMCVAPQTIRDIASGATWRNP